MHPGDEKKLAHARDVLQKKARDHARTPVQWTSETNAGFCPPDVTPWMRVNDDYKTINAQAQQKQNEPNQLSVLKFWKRALENRKMHKDVFVYGDYQTLDEDNPKIFAYKRSSGTEAFVVALNFSKNEITWEIPDDAKVKQWVAHNYTAGKPEQPATGKVTLKPWEGFLGECD